MSLLQSAEETAPVTLDREQIELYIPHRGTALLIDRIVELEPNVRAVGTILLKGRSDRLFEGHFPGNPVMPGFQILEALGQVAGVLAAYSDQSLRGKLFGLAGFDKARFPKSAYPGDKLRLEVTKTKVLGGLWVFSGRAIVRDGDVERVVATAKQLLGGVIEKK